MQKPTSFLHPLNLKNLTLAVFAALSLGVGVADAQSLSHQASSQQPNTNQSNWLGGGGG